MAKKGSASEMAKTSVDDASQAESSHSGASNDGLRGNGKYTVVARRYRPKTFAELVGQSTVSQALLSAIESNRVGHAYLFTGARGVGKTSTARIFAKALNAAAETDGKFDPDSDISQAIDAGEDMDVLEIDGASNRGIDEIRQLRANAAVRPSRSRYKIYIIDEVHMLTTQAFNALLKTLEEPPGHVKFIFCTTDPEKIPITVLSRCQRFDFPPVQTEQIYERLKFICQNEGTEADEAALRLIARRAAGSMRDSQSLLEQLLSFSGNQITAEVVHSMLGTADESRLASFASRLIERDAAGALRELNAAAEEGVDMGQLAEQLLGYLRDMMTVTVGGDADLVRTANPNSVDQLREWGKAWGTMTLLSALQLLDETIVKMRHSVQSRILLEVAMVQICNLQDLQALSDLVKALATQSSPVARPAVTPPATPILPDAKKKTELAPPVQKTPQPTPAPMPLISRDNTSPESERNVSLPPKREQVTELETQVESVAVPAKPALPKTQETQPAPLEEKSRSSSGPASAQVKPNPSDENQEREKETIDQPDAPESREPIALVRDTAVRLGGLAGECAMMAVRVECLTDQQWKVCLSRDGSIALNYFQTAENGRRLSQAISNRIRRDVRLEFVLTQEPTPVQDPAQAQPVDPVPIRPTNTPAIPQPQLIRNAMLHPLIKQFMEVFEAQVVRVDPAQAQVPSLHIPIQSGTSQPQSEVIRLDQAASR